MSMKHTQSKLSIAQMRVLRAIVDGTYYPMVLHGKTLQSLITKGMVERHDGFYPPKYVSTSAGVAAVTTGSAA